jgi:hypothetical protein
MTIGSTEGRADFLSNKSKALTKLAYLTFGDWKPIRTCLGAKTRVRPDGLNFELNERGDCMKRDEAFNKKRAEVIQELQKMERKFGSKFFRPAIRKYISVAAIKDRNNKRIRELEHELKSLKI